MTGAIADCERILHWFWGQPVNSITALAFVASGIWIARRGLRLVGLATALVGVGSFLFHGPMPAGAQWAHDVTLAWLLAVVGLVATDRRQWAAPALVGLAVVIGLIGTVADPLAVALTVVVGGVLLTGNRRSTVLAPGVLLGVAAVIGRLSATGGPLCRPDSLWQGHGLWHLAAAFSVAWWAHRWLQQDAPSPAQGSRQRLSQ